jgi:zinc D-Ala-D-Ala carboxypeptidase
MNLTEHFSLEEMTFSETASRRGWDNTPPIGFQENLTRVATLLEQVRKIVNKPIQVTSGYRCKNLNEAVGSKETSQHRNGCAADFKVSGMTPDAIVKAIIESDIQFDQLIREFDSWVHISVPNTKYMTPRNQALIIDKKGSRPYQS